MTLSFQVLGDAGQDNALLVTIDSGQAISRLLFDCGEGCLTPMPLGDIQAIDHVCFSHLHMDHIAGFDTFFRCVYGRNDRPNHLWGPPASSIILHHRFQGFLWNLVAGQQATWYVHDVSSDRIQTQRLELAEAFTQTHAEPERAWQGSIFEGPGYTVEALLLDHGTPSLAYVVREKPRVNIDPARLAALGLRPGPWLQRIRGPRADEAESILIEGTSHRIRQLQDALLTISPGDAVAYLTDFRLDAVTSERLSEVLQGIGTVVCESQYRHDDLELALRNYHMTATQAADLARRAAVGQLVLFHLSRRYQPEVWRAMLAEAQAIFPATTFPSHWAL